MSVWDKQHGGSHYQNFKIQPSKFVVENELLFPEGCAIKYICRHRLKGKKQDILKAIHFLEMIIERDYKEIEKPKEEEKKDNVNKKNKIKKGYKLLRLLFECTWFSTDLLDIKT